MAKEYKNAATYTLHGIEEVNYAHENRYIERRIQFLNNVGVNSIEGVHILGDHLHFRDFIIPIRIGDIEEHMSIENTSDGNKYAKIYGVFDPLVIIYGEVELETVEQHPTYCTFKLPLL